MDTDELSLNLVSFVYRRPIAPLHGDTPTDFFAREAVMLPQESILSFQFLPFT